MGLRNKLIIAATNEADMRYASGLSMPDPFILLDTGRRKHLLVSKLEYSRVKRHDVLLWDSYYERVKREKGWRDGSLLAKMAALYLQERKIKKVWMSKRALALHVEELRKRGIEVKLGDLYDRSVKAKEEVREIKKVRNATVKAMRVCIGIIAEATVNRKGELLFQKEQVTSERLKVVARKILLEQECEAPSIIISHGTQTAKPHHEGKGVLRAGEPIMMDFYPRSMRSGYWFDMTRTVCKGSPSAEVRKLYAAVKAAQDAALQRVKAGVKASSVDNAAAEELARRGYKTTTRQGFLHSTGHGVGLEIHEAPSIASSSEERLKAGMIITIEPGLYYKYGVRIENTIMVTTKGYKDLTRMKRVLHV